MATEDESFATRHERDAETRKLLSDEFVASGEKARLEAQLESKLNECGWRDDMKARCKDLIRSRGLENVSVEDLVQAVTPAAKDAVPREIQSDMLHQLEAFIEKNAK